MQKTRFEIAVKGAFPTATVEIRSAGTALAAGLPTACVFHAMRAVEIGVRALDGPLQLKLKHPIDLADWQAILTATNEALVLIGKEPRSAKRDEDMRFFSTAGAQFQFFKDGWRVRAAHARETFNETQARIALDHVTAFFEIISTRLKEAGT